LVTHGWRNKGTQSVHEDHPEVLLISNAKADGAAEGLLGNNEFYWHTDSPYFECPLAIGLLHAVLLPKAGGDTYFVDMCAVYDALTETKRRMIEDKLIKIDLIYDGNGAVRDGQQVPETDDIWSWPGICHPIVCNEEGTSRKYIFIGAEANIKYACILGLSRKDSAEILADIMYLVRLTEHQFKQVWEDGDMIM
jgi:taurine dioxygenase